MDVIVESFCQRRSAARNVPDSIIRRVSEAAAAERCLRGYFHPLGATSRPIKWQSTHRQTKPQNILAPTLHTEDHLLLKASFGAVQYEFPLTLKFCMNAD